MLKSQIVTSSSYVFSLIIPCGPQTGAIRHQVDDVMQTKKSIITLPNHIEPLIHVIRGHRVMLDSDLAALYGVTTKRLNEQVARNHQRFPIDFAFQLTE